MTPKVFVIQRPTPNKAGWLPDLSSASMYGAIDYVFEPEDRIQQLPGPAVRKARETLRTFRNGIDFLLWPNTGDPTAVFICVGVLVQQGIQELKILRWQRYFEKGDEASGKPKRGTYMPMTIFF